MRLMYSLTPLSSLVDCVGSQFLGNGLLNDQALYLATKLSKLFSLSYGFQHPPLARLIGTTATLFYTCFSSSICSYTILMFIITDELLGLVEFSFWTYLYNELLDCLGTVLYR